MIFLLFLPLLLLICYFCVAFFVNAAMFKPYKKIKPSATDGHKVIFRSGRNRLAGYLWNESGTRGLIVFAHGMGTEVEYYLPEIHHFATQGYKVFAFEYSGYCSSSGHFYGFPQAVIDLKYALDFVDDGSLPVILMGHSMGAYAVCAVGQCTDKHVDGRQYNLRCLATDGTHTQAVDLPAINDIMQLTRRGTLERVGEYTVAESHKNADGTCDIILNEKLPEDTEKYYIENISACPDFVFSHCRVRNHKARSVLIKTKRATVEHCIFEHSDLTAVVVSAEEMWGEGTSSEHVEMRNNVFIDCAMRGDRASAIDVFTASEQGTGKQHKEIIVRNNTIICPRGLEGISIENTEKAIVENNRIIHSL